MTIHLTPEIETALAEAAQREGTTPELLALDCLRHRFVTGMATPPVRDQRTLADLLAGHIGVLDSREFVPEGANMSENTGAKFTAGLVEKRAQGRL